MARRFVDGDKINIALGAGVPPTRAGTFVLLIRPIDSAFGILSSNTDLVTTLTGTSSVAAVLLSSGKMYANGDFGSGGPSLTNKDTWYILVTTKVESSTGAQPFDHYLAAVGDASFQHVASGSSTDAGTADNILFGTGPIIGGSKFEIAAAAMYPKPFTASDVAALGTTSMQPWLDAYPSAAWKFNQASVATPVKDITGNGSDQTAITGTAVTADPVGWSYGNDEEALNWTNPPSVTNGNDSQAYNLGTSFHLANHSAVCYGIRWRVPDIYIAPPGGVHGFAIWDDVANSQLGYFELDLTSVPTGPGPYALSGYEHDFFFPTPFTLTTGKTYVATVYTQGYAFRGSTPTTDGILSPSGNIVPEDSRLYSWSGGASTAPKPTSTFTASYYISPIMGNATAGPSTTPFSLSLPESYRILNAWSASLGESYRILNSWSVSAPESYRILNAWSQSLAESYRILNSWSVSSPESYRILNAWNTSLAESYRVLNAWAVAAPESYRVLNAWSKSLLETWDILAATGTAFSVSLQERYRIGDVGVTPPNTVLVQRLSGLVTVPLVVYPTVQASRTNSIWRVNRG